MDDQKVKPLARKFLLARGSCCGNRCFHCPYIDDHGQRHQLGSTLIYDMEKKALFVGFNTFLDRWNIALSKQAQTLITESYDITRASVDPLHDHRHTERLLKTFNYILERDTEGVFEKLDFEVMLLAIAWHDVWRSTRTYTHVVSLLYSFWWEALGSMRMFNKAAKKVGLDDSVRRSVAYAIRKHHSVQFLKRNTLEARVLKDLDELDVWSFKRVKAFHNYYFARPKPIKGFKRLTNIYMKIKERRSLHTLYFESSRQLLTKRQESFFQKLKQLLR